MKRLEVRCPTCRTEVEVHADSIRQDRADKKSDRRFLIIRLNCPNCQKPVQFSVLK